jgi:flagellar assembly factor FliW
VKILKEKYDQDKMIRFQNRFGEIFISKKNIINFPKGIIGIPSSKQFGISNFVNDPDSNFKLLQDIKNENLCFLVLPINLDNQFIARPDIEEAISSINLDIKNTSILLICSTKKEEKTDRTKLSFNAKAPIFIDLTYKLAYQHVLHNKNYSLNHIITK